MSTPPAIPRLFEASRLSTLLGVLSLPASRGSFSCGPGVRAPGGRSSAPFASSQEGGPVLVGEGGLRYRALAVEADDGLVWFWIGSHADYGNMVG